MSSHGATLQNFNSELVRSLEGLRERRDNILIDIKKDEQRKNEIEQIIDNLQNELESLSESLERKSEVRNEFEKVIGNTESAYFKLLEGSQTLLEILKRDEMNLMKRIKTEK